MLWTKYLSRISLIEINRYTICFSIVVRYSEAKSCTSWVCPSYLKRPQKCKKVFTGRSSKQNGEMALHKLNVVWYTSINVWRNSGMEIWNSYRLEITAFSIECIRKWRKGLPGVDYLETKFCLVCNLRSKYIIPSCQWIETEEDKKRIFQEFKFQDRKNKCKCFMMRKSCPLKDQCFYRHVRSNCKEVVLGNPKFRPILNWTWITSRYSISMLKSILEHELRRSKITNVGIIMSKLSEV